MSGGGMEQRRYNNIRPIKAPTESAPASHIDVPDSHYVPPADTDIQRWISGQDVPVPDILIAIVGAAKKGEIDIISDALEHLKEIESDPPSWLLYASNIVRGITNKCSDADIKRILPSLLHIKDHAACFQEESNPLKYSLNYNPIRSIQDDISRRIQNGEET